MKLINKVVTLGLSIILLFVTGTLAFASESTTYGRDEKQVTISNVISSVEATPMKQSNNSQEMTSYDVKVSTGAIFSGNYDINTIYLYTEEDMVDLASSDVMKYVDYEVDLEDAGIVVDKILENYELQAGYTLEFTKAGTFRLFMMDNESLDDRMAFNISVIEGADSNVEEDKVVEEVQLPETITAVPTASKVLVNGMETSFDAYTIKGNNYFKLRDIATVVNGTEKQFGVDWDNEKSAINLTSNSEYIPVGGEMSKGDEIDKQGLLNQSKIYMDGEEIQLTAYTIDGNNFFKLRDVAQVFDIGVTWDGETQTVGIDTTIGYVAE